MSSTSIARIISFVLGPFFWIPVLFIIVLANADLTYGQARVLIPTIFILDVVVPISYLVFAPRLGLTKSWEINDRMKRTQFYLLVGIMTFLTLVVVYLIGSNVLFAYNLIFFVLVSTYLLINLKWKISGHAAMNTLGISIIVLVYGWHLAWLFLLILPLVYWSRMKLRRHSIWQLLAGSGVTLIVFGIGVALFRQMGLLV